jgi:hypothetical protein
LTLSVQDVADPMGLISMLINRGVSFERIEGLSSEIEELVR